MRRTVPPRGGEVVTTVGAPVATLSSGSVSCRAWI